MRYHPHTASEIAEMLQVVGVSRVEELFASIPDPLRLTRPLQLPEPLAEPELVAHLQGLARKNQTAGQELVSFLGAGAYRHHIPAVVGALASRGEFLTAYTPYQAEVAQGTLQVIFEFQTLVAELFGIDMANASMYDGATATAEATLMGLRLQRAEAGQVAVSQALHPQYRAVLATYLGAEALVALPTASGTTTAAAVKEATGCRVVVVQQPNFYGCVEDLEALAAAAHEQKALLVVATTEPTAFGLLEAPGRLGADIVCGEGQPLGLPTSLGGPGVGLLGGRQEYLRAMPGRLVGQTEDTRGQTGYVLTLSAREQHIRREKATSNICSNQGLCALMVTIYLSLLGRTGLRQLAERNLSAIRYLRERLVQTPGVTLPYPTAPVFNELTIRLDGRNPVQLRDELLCRGILAGHPLTAADVGHEFDDGLLVHASELHTREELDRLADALAIGEGRTTI